MTRRVTTLVAAGVLFAFTVAQRPARTFYFDAMSYWSGTRAGWVAVFGDGSGAKAGWEPFLGDSAVVEAGSLGLRGILAFLVYSPAALVDRFFRGTGQAAVLIENSLIIAVLGAVVLPAIARALGVRGPVVVYACAALVWLVVARFAPYPLMDLPAAAVFLCAVLFASTRSYRGIALAGLCAGIAFNIRPSYLVPLAAVVVALAVTHRLRILWLLPGVTVALLPQVFLNTSQGFGWVPTPPKTAALADFQAGLSSYVVRYDTVLSDSPQQFYCDPHMAGAIAGHDVTSTTDFIRTVATNIPWSVGFLAQKFSAALGWSSYTPYSAPAPMENYNSLLPVAVITVCGTLALIALAVSRPRGRPRAYPLTVVAALLGACTTLVTSATETRFALPVVLLGILGSALLLPAVLGEGRAMSRGWWVAAAVGTVLVVTFASVGLAHPLPSGPAEARACADLR